MTAGAPFSIRFQLFRRHYMGTVSPIERQRDLFYSNISLGGIVTGSISRNFRWREKEREANWVEGQRAGKCKHYPEGSL